MKRFAAFLLALGVAMAPALSGEGLVSSALAQDATPEAAPAAPAAQAGQDATPTANPSPSGSLVGFRASERLSNPQAWQTSANGDIRFCYVITEVTDESGESFYLEEFQLRCTQWR